MNQSTMNQAPEELSLDERMDVFLSKYKSLIDDLFILDVTGATKKKKRVVKNKIIELIEEEIFHEEEMTGQLFDFSGMTEKEQRKAIKQYKKKLENREAEHKWIDYLNQCLEKLTA